jgi:O-antigen/teichoic acid export membrane protein
MNARHPARVWAAVVVGVALIALAVLYWIEPAGSLPSFIPGHEAGSGHHHVKHGIAAFFVGVALLVYSWFQTGGDRKIGLSSSS